MTLPHPFRDNGSHSTHYSNRYSTVLVLAVTGWVHQIYGRTVLFLIALTFGSYVLGKRLRRRTGWVVMTPILVAIVVVIAFLELTGAVCGYKTMGFAHVRTPKAQGLSMGTAAHALGTATSMDVSNIHGAYASLGLTLNGIFTALLTPSIIPLVC